MNEAVACNLSSLDAQPKAVQSNLGQCKLCLKHLLLNKEKIDFVFIDAGHSTKSVTKDINAYRPLLKNSKGLTGHDIDFPAVQTALAQLGIEFDVGPDNTWIKK